MLMEPNSPKEYRTASTTPMAFYRACLDLTSNHSDGLGFLARLTRLPSGYTETTKGVANTTFYLNHHPLINLANSLSSAAFAGLAARLALVSPPCTVFAIPQRFRPSFVLGPVDLPPWNLQTRFSLTDGAPHCCLVLLDKAWHRLHRILSAARVMNGSPSLLMQFTSIG
mgnify:CR=1 FL=1